MAFEGPVKRRAILLIASVDIGAVVKQETTKVASTVQRRQVERAIAARLRRMFQERLEQVAGFWPSLGGDRGEDDRLGIQMPRVQKIRLDARMDVWVIGSMWVKQKQRRLNGR